jgi:hypothetical protein
LYNLCLGSVCLFTTDDSAMNWTSERMGRTGYKVQTLVKHSHITFDVAFQLFGLCLKNQSIHRIIYDFNFCSRREASLCTSLN